MLHCQPARSFSLLVMACAAVSCSAPKTDVTAFAAASVTDVVEDAASTFEAQTGDTVAVSAAATSVLAQQIAAGAEADVFLSADIDWIEYLEERGLVESRVDLLGNQLVLVAPVDDATVNSPEDLLKDSVKRIAVADTDSVPAGRYAKKALIHLGLWDALKPKLMPGGDVRQALLYVEQGEAEAGLVYATDARVSGKVRTVYGFEDDATGAVVYPLILTRHGADSERARAFFKFLQSDDVLTSFDQRGFRPLNR